MSHDNVQNISLFSHFHPLGLDTPGVGCLVEGVLHHPGDGLPLRQDLGQVPGAQHIPQGGGGQKPGGVRVVLNVADCLGHNNNIKQGLRLLRI